MSAKPHAYDECRATQALARARKWPDAIPRLVGRGEIAPAPSANELPLVISWFSTGKPKGRAIGDAERTFWSNLAAVLSSHRRDIVELRQIARNIRQANRYRRIPPRAAPQQAGEVHDEQ
jgi:hypothetical protein